MKKSGPPAGSPGGQTKQTVQNRGLRRAIRRHLAGGQPEQTALREPESAIGCAFQSDGTRGKPCRICSNPAYRFTTRVRLRIARLWAV